MSGRTSSPLLFFRKRFPRFGSRIAVRKTRRTRFRTWICKVRGRNPRSVLSANRRLSFFARTFLFVMPSIFSYLVTDFTLPFPALGREVAPDALVSAFGNDCVFCRRIRLAAEMRSYKDTGMAVAVWLITGLLAGLGLVVGRNPRVLSRCASSSDAGLAGRKARRAVLRVFLGSAFVTAAGGTLTLALGWRGTTWLFLTAPVLVALIAAIGMSAGESRRSSDAAVVPVLLALLFGLPALVAGYAVFSLRDPSLSLSPDRLRIGGLWGTDSVERTFFRPSGRHAAFRRGTDGRARYGNDPQGLFPAERYRYGEADADLGQGSVHLYAKTIGTVCRFEFRRGGTNGPLVRTDKRDAR